MSGNPVYGKAECQEMTGNRRRHWQSDHQSVSCLSKVSVQCLPNASTPVEQEGASVNAKANIKNWKKSVSNFISLFPGGSKRLREVDDPD
jgi:hypothetical protein